LPRRGRAALVRSSCLAMSSSLSPGSRQTDRVLLQNLDDLLFGVSALTHVRLPKERTLPKNGAFKGSGHWHRISDVANGCSSGWRTFSTALSQALGGAGGSLQAGGDPEGSEGAAGACTGSASFRRLATAACSARAACLLRGRHILLKLAHVMRLCWRGKCWTLTGNGRPARRRSTFGIRHQRDRRRGNGLRKGGSS
jgi:hypothetical protein